MKPNTLVLIAALGLIACSKPGNSTPITGIEWTLVELEGTPAQVGAEGKPVTLQLFASEQRAGGFAGCNQYSSAYEMTGTTLHFTPAISTKMACATGMDLEQRYLKAFEGTQRFRQTGNRLELVGPDDQVLASFEKRI